MQVVFTVAETPLKMTPSNQLKTHRNHDPNNINDTNKNLETAIFAGGCFWGMQYYFEKAKRRNQYCCRLYWRACYKSLLRTSLHPHNRAFEAIQVTYDPSITSYEAMAKLFFDIHDPTQTDGQGPDIGEQYMSVVFYADDAQRTNSSKSN